MRTDAEAVARVCWEANRQLQIADGEVYFDEPWDAAPEWRKKITVGTVTLVQSGIITGPGEAHEHWAHSMRLMEWKWGADKDPERRLHPSLVPWEELTPRGQLGQRLLFMITTEIAQADSVVLHCACDRR